MFIEPKKKAARPVQKQINEAIAVSGCADLPGNPCSLAVRAKGNGRSPAEASENEWTLGIVGDLGTHVLDPPLPFVPEKVEAQTVFRGIGFCSKTSSQHHPLGCIHKTFKDRILHPLAMILA
jgi:hypothetical protein